MSGKIKDYIENGKIDLEKVINDYENYISTIVDNMSKRYLKEEDKEEIVSDVICVLWKNKEKLDINKILSPYIAGITRNVTREYLRKINFNCDISDFENNLYTVDKFSINDENLDKLNKVENELEKMKDVYKRIFINFYNYSKSIKDIAKEKKLSEFSVKQRLYRIRKKIRKNFK